MLVTAAVVCALPSARADDPAMTNHLWGTGCETGSFDTNSAGPELQIGFQLVNTSTNNIPANNLVSFSYPAGTNQGVYRVKFLPHPQHWTAAITDNVTTITNPGVDLAPGQGTYIFIYSVFTNTSMDAATALAAGSGGGPVPFNSLQVFVPVQPPDPGPFVEVLSAGISPTIKLTNLKVGGTTALMQTSDPISGNWKLVTNFVASSPTTNLSVSGGSSGTSILFYRAVQTQP